MKKKVVKYSSDNPMMVFKGFGSDLSCRGYQYVMGKNHHVSLPIKRGNNGLHACRNPIETFEYHSPHNAVFAAVGVWGVIRTGSTRDIASTKLAAEYMRVQHTIGYSQLALEAEQWYKENMPTRRKVIATHMSKPATYKGWCMAYISHEASYGVAYAIGRLSYVTTLAHKGTAVTTNRESIAHTQHGHSVAVAKGPHSMAVAEAFESVAVVSADGCVAATAGEKSVAVASCESKASTCGDQSVAISMGPLYHIGTAEGAGDSLLFRNIAEVTKRPTHCGGDEEAPRNAVAFLPTGGGRMRGVKGAVLIAICWGKEGDTPKVLSGVVGVDLKEDVYYCISEGKLVEAKIQ